MLVPLPSPPSYTPYGSVFNINVGNLSGSHLARRSKQETMRPDEAHSAFGSGPALGPQATFMTGALPNAVNARRELVLRMMATQSVQARTVDAAHRATKPRVPKPRRPVVRTRRQHSSSLAPVHAIHRVSMPPQLRLLHRHVNKKLLPSLMDSKSYAYVRGRQPQFFAPPPSGAQLRFRSAQFTSPRDEQNQRRRQQQQQHQHHRQQ